MIKNIVFACMILVTIAAACQKRSVSNVNSDRLQIRISSAGGWCSGSDSLTLSKDQAVYVFRTTCQSDEKTISENTDPTEWNALVDVSNAEKFNAINLDACGVCYDGSDETITIRDKDIAHTIRYDKLDDSRLDAIRPFINKLRLIRDSIRGRAKNK